jgi:hypothetical protein
MSPAMQTMQFYFKPSAEKGFRGRPRSTLVTTLDTDLQKVAQKITNLETKRFNSLMDITILKSLAQDRDWWNDSLIKEIQIIVEVEASYIRAVETTQH